MRYWDLFLGMYWKKCQLMGFNLYFKKPIISHGFNALYCEMGHRQKYASINPSIRGCCCSSIIIPASRNRLHMGTFPFPPHSQIWKLALLAGSIWFLCFWSHSLSFMAHNCKVISCNFKTHTKHLRLNLTIGKPWDWAMLVVVILQIIQVKPRC